LDKSESKNRNQDLTSYHTTTVNSTLINQEMLNSNSDLLKNEHEIFAKD